jgi:hypothetical protein
MTIQKIAFSELRSFLKNIVISDYFIDYDGGTYEDFIQTKKANDEIEWYLTYNNEDHRKISTFLIEKKDAFFNEISTNRALMVDKISIHIYFKEVYELFNPILNEINYDDQAKKWSCNFASYTERFSKNDLDKYFSRSIQEFFMLLNDYIIDIKVNLNNIEEYRECLNNIEVSTQGNLKIVWSENTNKLVDYFLKMVEGGLIDTSHENLKRFIINNFLDKNSRELSQATIDTYFKPSAGKSPKRDPIDPGDFLKQ